jgi:hypothetical protein
MMSESGQTVAALPFDSKVHKPGTLAILLCQKEQTDSTDGRRQGTSEPEDEKASVSRVDIPVDK